MRDSRMLLACAALVALAGCAAGPPSSYPAGTRERLAFYAQATPCCDDPSGFRFVELPQRGFADASIDRASPVFDFHSGMSPFVAFKLPDAPAPYRLRVKSLFEPGEDSPVFYPVVAVLDDAYIVTHLTGLDSLRVEPALATAGGETGLTVTVPINPITEKGRYLVVFTPAALLGAAPDSRRDGDLLTPSSLAWLERRGEAASPASPYGRIRITIAPDVPIAAAGKDQRSFGRRHLLSRRAQRGTGDPAAPARQSGVSRRGIQIHPPQPLSYCGVHP